MKYLLDTQAFLFYMSGDSRIGKKAKKIISDELSDLYFSAASYWEICIKVSINKLVLHEKWQKIISDILVANDITWLAIEKEHCDIVSELPFENRDPFDRILAAQARREKMQIVSSDRVFEAYKVNRYW